MPTLLQRYKVDHYSITVEEVDSVLKRLRPGKDVELLNFWLDVRHDLTLTAELNKQYTAAAPVPSTIPKMLEQE